MEHLKLELPNREEDIISQALNVKWTQVMEFALNQKGYPDEQHLQANEEDEVDENDSDLKVMVNDDDVVLMMILKTKGNEGEDSYLIMDHADQGLPQNNNNVSQGFGFAGKWEEDVM
ncbi:hypothetical protein Tco_0890400 [Tanacetum coccineum]|uniref:Uncharacterized protein n=1 Tax=Tanacetum coccineum TaxID=301880 RepID=A0ABQ5C3D9_9ASTR